jgi:Flp pilus assembly protein TadB
LLRVGWCQPDFPHSLEECASGSRVAGSPHHLGLIGLIVLIVLIVLVVLVVLVVVLILVVVLFSFIGFGVCVCVIISDRGLKASFGHCMASLWSGTATEHRSSAVGGQ